MGSTITKEWVVKNMNHTDGSEAFDYWLGVYSAMDGIDIFNLPVGTEDMESFERCRQGWYDYHTHVMRQEVKEAGNG